MIKMSTLCDNCRKAENSPYKVSQGHLWNMDERDDLSDEESLHFYLIIITGPKGLSGTQCHWAKWLEESARFRPGICLQ